MRSTLPEMLDDSRVNAVSTLQKPALCPRLGHKPVFEEMFALRIVYSMKWAGKDDVLAIRHGLAAAVGV
jgi:hypothetical protein